MLEVAPDPAVDLQAPELNVASAVSELAERDPHFHEPPVVGDAGRKVPYRVPRRVAETGSRGSPARIRAAADRDDLVALYAPRVDGEAVRRPMVAGRSADDDERVGSRAVRVTAPRPGGHRAPRPRPPRVAEAGVAISAPPPGGLGHGGALIAFDLGEGGGRRGRLPGVLSGPSID